MTISKYGIPRNHPDYKKLAGKVYYQKNKEAIEQRRKENKKSGRWKDRRSYERRMWTTAKSRAAKKGLEFNIEPSDITVPEYCPIFGIKLVIRQGQGCEPHDASPSLDRIDSSKGYIKGNIQVISIRANLLKNSATIEELESIIRYMKNGIARGQS